MEQQRNFYIKQLASADITPGLLDGFAHCQKITRKWVKKNNVWEQSDVSILREWSGEKRIRITEYMCRQIERGGITVGAFFHKQLVGFCCVDGIVSGNLAKYANLTMLFVDDNWKRNGIGKLLLQEARNHACRLGAEKIFISAIPSQETIAFYFKTGCADAREIVEPFVDSEDDRCLELAVNAADSNRQLPAYKTGQHLFHSADIDVRIMDYADIPSICRADCDESPENIDYLKRQLDNQEKGECAALLALYNDNAAGYVLLYYQCRWGGLGGHHIPGIVDLIVFEKYRRKKIATVLLDIAEDIAGQHCDKIYLDVCLNSSYGPAQRFYIKRGYIPDGKGVYYEEKICETGAVCRNDDELTLCLVKEL